MVAVESGSMQPHMTRGDLVVISEPGRFASDAEYGSTGISTYRTAKGMGVRNFGSYGSVIVYQPPGRSGSPIIHRSRFWVEAGENWYGKTDPGYVDAENCSELRNCAAPNSGFVTKGDDNRAYDQATGLAPPVKPE
ncbi:S26 family signal peptidase [Halorarum halophilum]|uniref:S26 family signal peptidase n=1 Tax=Halorarum halophilum TaxID=2743090 RepID=A0A7D5KFV0_9EURY|nr:S26 family signal peptidase [Halobaculum halophilum]QLG29277.1 S26 family signal peptidase [Halobaculum halophilum]